MFRIPDKRSTHPEDYEDFQRRGRLKQSWHIGVTRQSDGTQSIDFQERLTWGSIGQILGYLLGEVDEDLQDKLYDRMLAQYKLTDRGKVLKTAESDVG